MYRLKAKSERLTEEEEKWLNVFWDAKKRLTNRVNLINLFLDQQYIIEIEIDKNI